MAMDPLATAADLYARNITIPNGFDEDVILASASAAVRDAAGCPVLRMTATVTLVADSFCSLDLPGGPVSSVDTVAITGGAEITGWTKIGNTILFPPNWTRTLPLEVDVTYTFGLVSVPSDIVDLVCALAATAFAADGSYGQQHVLASTRLGESAETYAHPKGEQVSPVGIPDATRDRLRARFGTSAATVRISR